jgi:type IV pilus assembly protein PilF
VKTALLASVIAATLLVSGCAVNSGVARLSDDEKAANYNAELGANYLATGSLENAQVKLQRALAQDPNNALANNAYGKLLAALDDPKGAEKAFVKSIRLDEKRAEYRNNYGIFLCDRNRTSDAIEQFVAASENKFYQTPEFALDNAGLCALGDNRYDEAEQHLRAAIRHNAKFAPAILHMAELKLKTGDAVLADAYYARFTSLSRQTPQSLSVGINIKREIGDELAVQQYGKELVTSYPRSRQAQLYLAAQ